MNVPCHRCEKRYLKCHAYCEEYKAFQEERSSLRETRKKRVDTESFFIEGARRRLKKYER